MNNLKELLMKPVWQMTGEEFLFLSRHASVQAEVQTQPTTDTERKYVYGILGIAKLFRVQPAHSQPHQEKRKDRQGHYPDRTQDYRGCGTGA
jgi:hypothetical protein